MDILSYRKLNYMFDPPHVFLRTVGDLGRQMHDGHEGNVPPTSRPL